MLRVIDAEGKNIGVLSLREALVKSGELGLDLIEISPTANPPVAKITDYGRFLYELNKKRKAARPHAVEVKSVQIKIGTSDHDLALKAKKVTEWLRAGQRIKIGLFLPGRYKYMNENFLKERLARILPLIAESYKIAEPATRSPKGLTMVVERA